MPGLVPGISIIGAMPFESRSPDKPGDYKESYSIASSFTSTVAFSASLPPSAKIVSPVM